jgi:hypothetical protein
MDLNYLFHRQQVERSLASFADSEPARRAHAELAKLYERKIERASGGRLRFARTRKALADHRRLFR